MRTLTSFRLQHFRTCRVSVICLNVNFFTALSLSAEERAHNETVEGKWEQIQYYESRWNKQHQHQEQSEPGLDPAGGFNSLARYTRLRSIFTQTKTSQQKLIGLQDKSLVVLLILFIPNFYVAIKAT